MLLVKVQLVKVLQAQGMTMALKNIHQMCCSNNIRMTDTWTGCMTKPSFHHMMLQVQAQVQGLVRVLQVQEQVLVMEQLEQVQQVMEQLG